MIAGNISEEGNKMETWQLILLGWALGPALVWVSLFWFFGDKAIELDTDTTETEEE